NCLRTLDNLTCVNHVNAITPAAHLRLRKRI
ncbi:unnamed protein product, partial [Rotaria sp. Silwood2]